MNALETIDSVKEKIPYGYYTVYCVPVSGDTSETGVFLLDASDEEITPAPDNPDTTPDPDTNNNRTSGGGGGGGGCNAGILGALMLMVGFILRKKR